MCKCFIFIRHPILAIHRASSWHSHTSAIMPYSAKFSRGWNFVVCMVSKSISLNKLLLTWNIPWSRLQSLNVIADKSLSLIKNNFRVELLTRENYSSKSSRYTVLLECVCSHCVSLAIGLHGAAQLQHSQWLCDATGWLQPPPRWILWQTSLRHAQRTAGMCVCVCVCVCLCAYVWVCVGVCGCAWVGRERGWLHWLTQTHTIVSPKCSINCCYVFHFARRQYTRIWWRGSNIVCRRGFSMERRR